MLTDYEIARKKNIIEKIMPFIELMIMLIIIQSIVTLFTGVQADEESIRFRVLAHSDATSDQQVKMEIQQEIQPLIEKAVAAAQTKKEIVDNLAKLEQTILEAATLLADGRPVSLERTQALFPPKRSGLIIYPQAAYDAYVLTIGSGRGDNWWCALFPKICFPDKEEKEEEKEKEKVTFFIWEWIKGIIS